MRVVLALAVAAATLLGVSGSAAARGTAPDTFDGTCTMSGRLTFAVPLGFEPRETTFDDEASGTCSGLLNGARVEDVPAVNHATGSGTLSCGGGTARTADALAFPHGVRVSFTTTIAGALTQFAARFTGTAGGDGVVYVNALPYTDEAALAACAGSGLSSARYDLEARTLTPVAG